MPPQKFLHIFRRGYGRGFAGKGLGVYWVVLLDANDLDPQGIYRRIEIVDGPLLTLADASSAKSQAEARFTGAVYPHSLQCAVLTDAQVKQARQSGTFILDLRP